jgi:sterol 3beta-glucosyltransferase
MPLLPFLGIYRQLIKQHHPFLCAYSPLVVPKAHDWSTETHVTGYWFLNPLTSWEPPQDLIDFLSAGPPPIFIGFGSTTIRNSEDITTLVFEALKQTGQRGIIAQGWGGLSSANLPKSVFAVKDIPFDWLFPRMAALVHHGGAGTTAYGLRAGVPTIIIPFILDHFFWGRQITALGIGPQPILPKRLTTERLANAIHIVINDQALRTRASKIGEALQAEQGVEQVVRIIESIKASSLS